MAVVLWLASLMTMVMVQPLFVNSPADEDEIKLSEFVSNPVDLEIFEYEEKSLFDNILKRHTILGALIGFLVVVWFYQLIKLMREPQEIKKMVDDYSRYEDAIEVADTNEPEETSEPSVEKMKEDFVYDLWHGKYSNLTFNELMQMI